MKPIISFILQLPSKTSYENLDAVARNLMDGLNILLSSGKVRCSLFADGPTLEKLKSEARPLILGKFREAIQEGKLEILGGGFHDPMLPLFPRELQEIQIAKHKKLLFKIFENEPQGYFNSSLVWEMGMIGELKQAGFEYALVREAALQDALGRNTPISGWYSIEDKSAVMGIIPISDALSNAIEKDDLKWKEIAEEYNREGKPAIALLDLPAEPSEIVAFFERLIDFVETNDVQTWPASYLKNQFPKEGSISYLISAGHKLGLPATARTCREMLIRRPEINLHHKTLINLYHRAKISLKAEDTKNFFEFLLPAMSPLFFRDLFTLGGMQRFQVRTWGSRFLQKAFYELDKAMHFEAIRFEVCDYLLRMNKQIWLENAHLSALLDYLEGGVLRTLNKKGNGVNLLNVFHNDGEPSACFLDCLLPNAPLTPVQIGQKLSRREHVLNEFYEYQIERDNGASQIQLSEEQGFEIDGKNGILHIEKKYEISAEKSAVKVLYKITSPTYGNAKFYFGSLFEFALLDSIKQGGITVDGFDLKWDKETELIYPEGKKLEIKDKTLGVRLQMEFNIPCSIFVGSIFSSSESAAPNVYQGVCVYPFFKTDLKINDEKQIEITLTLKDA